MKYAIIQKGSKQYKVSEGQEILLDSLSWGDSKELELDSVLLVADDGKVEVGTPTVKGAKVVAEVLGDERGEKIRVVKYKAKSRYRRATGFRADYTRVKIQQITTK